MNIVLELETIEQREAEALQQLEELREMRKQAVKRLHLMMINHPLDRETVADLLGYNYYYMSRLHLPFENGKIFYLELLNWVKQHKPYKTETLEKNYRVYLHEQKRGNS